MNTELLNVDLNEIVSKEIGQKISSLEKQLESGNKTISDQRKEIKMLKERVLEAENTHHLFGKLRDTFSGIKEGEHDKSDWYDSRQKNQFLFIEQILSSLFGIKKAYNGWCCSRSDGSLVVHLAVNYYDHKKEICDLLQLLMKPEDSAKAISFLNAFKMPYDYSKDAVIGYVKAPKYNTNSAIFGVSNFWIEADAGLSNMPHDLIMKNPYILDEDVFSMLLESINKRVSEFHYLFALPEHNKNISDEQVSRLGECLITLNNRQLVFDSIKGFISKFILKFNHATLDFLYNFMSSDNQFRLLDWQKFPTEYQMRYLKYKDFDKVNKILNDYSCKWSSEEKKEFLKEYLNTQP
jgi:hypothetical protein